MENSVRPTHPLILVAAASVTLASLAAAAHFAGFLPSRASEPAPAPVAAVAPPPPVAAPAPVAAIQPAPLAKAESPAPVEAVKPAPKARVQHRASEPVRQPRRTDEDWRYQGGTHRVSANDAGIDVIPATSNPAPPPASVPVQAVPPVCRDCGTVEAVREVAAKGEGSGLGAIAGGVLGGVLGHQVGRGAGRDLATIAGAVGGAVAGHQVEKNVRTDKQYQVTVRFDDGSVRDYTLGAASWRTGDRVRLSNGTLVSLGS